MLDGLANIAMQRVCDNVLEDAILELTNAFDIYSLKGLPVTQYRRGWSIVTIAEKRRRQRENAYAGKRSVDAW